MMKKFYTISQIMILLLGIMAVSYAIGSEIGIVRADTETDNPVKKIPDSAKTSLRGTRGESVLGKGDWVERHKNLATTNPTPTSPSGDYGPKEGELPSTTTPKSDGDTSWFKNNPETVQALDKGYTSYLLQGVFIAGVVNQAVTIFSRQALGQDEQQAQTIGEAAGAGVMAGYVTNALEYKLTKGEAAGSYGTAVGVAVFLYYVYENWQETDTEEVTFTCTTWQAPRGGINCEKCNDNIFGCSEYQCKSLGRGCELLNPGTEEELCAWVNANDAEAPEIRPWEDALKEDYKYESDVANVIAPPDRGVVVQPVAGSDQCIPAYTPLSVGVQLDEPATCKMDSEKRNSYEEMQFFLGGDSLARYNHTQTMSLPSLNAEGIVLESGTNMSLYVRCEDTNGNSNVANFVFKFCVSDEEDFTPPLITESSVENNQYIANNLTEIDMQIFVNEPSECRWDFSDKRYDTMGTEMTCSQGYEVRNAQVVYPCSTTLTGIKDQSDNKYYFKCNDTSGNFNKDSFELNLKGTQPLFISSVKPEDTIKDKSSPVKVSFEVETSAGAEDGNSFCHYKNNLDTNARYVQFKYEENEMTYEHEHSLNLAEGDYNFSIKCIDAGGNQDFAEAIFSIETDLDDPIVVRAYKEDSFLKLITNEKGECFYSTDDEMGCEYDIEDGLAMKTVDENEHYIEWEPKETYYVKCWDEFENPPNPNECSIEVQPFEE